MVKRKILLLGGTSEIARNIMSALLRDDDLLVISGRDIHTLKPIAADLSIRYHCTVKPIAYDMNSLPDCTKFSGEVKTMIGSPDIIIAATGALGDQVKVRDSSQLSYQVAMSNYLGITSTIAPMIAAMAQRGSGHIIVLSSVAGDRGRESNYVYGAAKSAINSYLSGLRARLHGTGVRVSTVKLGFVETRMIAGMKSSFLVTKPKWIGAKIAALVDSPKDVLYLPKFWWLIMLIIKHIPEMIFKRLKVL